MRQLEAAAKKGELTLDWHWQENHIDPSITAPSQTVGFRLSSGPDGVNIPEVCTDWSSATKICSGTWRSITGDIDLVSVTAADGTPLSDRRYVNVLQKLSGTEVQNQHGATATWYWQLDDGSWIFDANDTQSFPLKAVNLKAGQCCLLQVGADGVPREVILNLQGSVFNTKNDYFLNYVGRELVPAP